MGLEACQELDRGVEECITAVNKEDSEKLEGFLKERTDDLRPLRRTLGAFHTHTQALKAYFINL